MPVGIIAGTIIEATGTFEDTIGVAFDPTEVLCYLESPHKVRLLDSIVVRQDTGVYKSTIQTPVDYKYVIVVFEGSVAGTPVVKYFGRTKVNLSYSE